MKNKVIAINGRYLCRKQTGQERFATEIVNELDKIVKPGVFELIVPQEYTNEIKYNNIKVVYYGKSKSHLWEQLDFYRYVRKNKRLSLNLCTKQPLLAPGIVCIHDISYKVNPQYFTNIYGRLSALWHRLHYNVAARFSPIILTVTEVSKREMCSVYRIPENKVKVVPNGWEHILRIKEDIDFEERFSDLQDGKYFISIGSLAPNKNMEWIFSNAKFNKDKQYVIVGKAMLNEYGKDYKEHVSDNIVMTGYVTDEELVCLLKHSKALIFPSVYEGFGIPPLEALALGKEVICSNVSCMPEILQDTVHYIDPHNSNINIDEVLSGPVESAEKVLLKYKYANAAKRIYDIISSLNS